MVFLAGPARVKGEPFLLGVVQPLRTAGDAGQMYPSLLPYRMRLPGRRRPLLVDSRGIRDAAGPTVIVATQTCTARPLYGAVLCVKAMAHRS